MGGIGGGRFKTKGGGNHSSGGMGVSAGRWDFVDHCHENEGVTACLGEWGCILQGWDLVVCCHH